MKILYLSTIIGTIDSFFVPHFKTFLEKGYIIDAAGNFKTSISEDLKKTTRNIYDLPLQRNPFSIKNLTALKSLLKLLKENKYDFIHVHTPVASVIGRLACLIAKTKCFYTAHGFHFYKGAPLLNWLIYFPIEWVLSFFTDTLITINKEDYEFAKKHLHARRIGYIPGVGIDVDKFSKIKVDIKAKRKELGIPEECRLLLSVGELNKNKNHAVVIRALAKLNDTKVHYAICGDGSSHNYLMNLARDLKLDERIHFLGRRNDIPEIMKCADLFVHPSLREGLPVSVMEALASGLFVVCSKVRGNIDLVENGSNGYIVDINNFELYAEALKKAINNIARKDYTKSLVKFDSKYICNEMFNMLNY